MNNTIQCTIDGLTLHFQHTWRISRGASDEARNVVVTLEHDGIVARGEAAPTRRYGETVESLIPELRSACETLDPERLVEYAALLDSLNMEHRSAKAALDMAVYDYVGQKLGSPLFRMWGLNPDDTPLTSFSIGIDTPEVIERKVEEADIYPILKVKLGTPSDRETIAAVRRVTDKPIRVDANEGWNTVEQALENIGWLADEGVEFVEQPLPAHMLSEMPKLRHVSPLPLVADENCITSEDIPHLVDAFDGINVKLMKSGGLLEAYRMIAVARACGLKTMLGCMLESSIGITAAAHLAPLVDWADLDGNLLLADDPYKGVRVEEGKLVLPEGPGLGVEKR